mgnify:CR=1 FL=1|tara:strand:+ start:343 stop:579 length:237 start_codon:yes stop_codon:yes gene_type:complete
MKVKIEKDVPLRDSFRTQNNKWREVLEEMDVGHSFLIDESDDENRAQYQNIRNQAKMLEMKIKGVKEDEHHRRIYRVE